MTRWRFLSGLAVCSLVSVEGVNAQSSAVELLQPAVFKQRMAEAPGVVIDVRTSEEWAEGVIEEARLIDFWGKGFAAEMKKIDMNVPVYVYCAVGGRSASAADLLHELGHKHVADLDGGMEAWRAAGYPVVDTGSGSKR